MWPPMRCSARFLRPTHLGSELALEGVDDLTQTLGVDALLASLKLAHRDLQFGERIELVQHAKSIPNICLGIKR